MTIKNKLPLIATLILTLGIAACDADKPAEVAADKIYFGDNIVTMDDGNEDVNAVAIKGNTIIFSGKRDKAKAFTDQNTELVELGDKALLPGFIDAHGHFTGTARYIDFANLSPPPVGSVKSIDDLVKQLQTFVASQEQNPEWIVGYGYDESLLKEQRHPTRADLDKISTELPVIVIHVSHHLASLNSAALKALNITAESPDPKGGIIRRLAGSTEPDGVLEEKAAYPAFYAANKFSPEQYEKLLRKSANYYASFGITTVQDGASNPNDIVLLRKIAAAKPLPIDLSMYEYVSTAEQVEGAITENNYHNGIKVSGVKFLIDGSPQGRTAWLTKPYLKNGTEQAADYIAYPSIDADFYKSSVSTLIKNKVQMISHANGDAAIDLMLEALEEATTGSDNDDHRAVIIHAQLMREDQIARAKSLNAIPSFFSAHPFFWGDWHRLNFGDARAENISPMAWAEKAGLRFTIHNDSPVVPPNMMRLLWVSTNRLARSGQVLGADQRVSVKTALRAMTIDAAYQNYEQDSKGSLSVGKQADMVILDQNPLKIDKADLADLSILETIARGKTVFKANNSN